MNDFENLILCYGTNKLVQLKRAHSADPASNTPPETSQRPPWGDNSQNSEDKSAETGAKGAAASLGAPANLPDEALIGSPLKKQRPSMDQSFSAEKFSQTQNLSAALESAVSGSSGSTPNQTTTEAKLKIEEEEEL